MESVLFDKGFKQTNNEITQCPTSLNHKTDEKQWLTN